MNRFYKPSILFKMHFKRSASDVKTRGFRAITALFEHATSQSLRNGNPASTPVVQE